ncbi:MAG: hypothetical protein JNM84_19360 [Planctomycetes bacterium]|nr:hypothetical protein [Planctomycetota bacterium]
MSIARSRIGAGLGALLAVGLVLGVLFVLSKTGREREPALERDPGLAPGEVRHMSSRTPGLTAATVRRAAEAEAARDLLCIVTGAGASALSGARISELVAEASSDESEESRSLVTDASGAARLAHRGGALRCEHPDHATAVLSTAEIEERLAIESEQRVLRIELVGLAESRLSLVDVDGSPVRGAAAELLAIERGSHAAAVCASASDEVGVVTIRGVRDAVFRIGVRKLGFAPQELVVVLGSDSPVVVLQPLLIGGYRLPIFSDGKALRGGWRVMMPRVEEDEFGPTGDLAYLSFHGSWQKRAIAESRRWVEQKITGEVGVDLVWYVMRRPLPLPLIRSFEMLFISTGQNHEGSMAFVRLEDFDASLLADAPRWSLGPSARIEVLFEVGGRPAEPPDGTWLLECASDGGSFYTNPERSERGGFVFTVAPGSYRVQASISEITHTEAFPRDVRVEVDAGASVEHVVRCDPAAFFSLQLSALDATTQETLAPCDVEIEIVSTGNRQPFELPFESGGTTLWLAPRQKGYLVRFRAPGYQEEVFGVGLQDAGSTVRVTASLRRAGG